MKGLLLQEQDALMRLGDPELDVEHRIQLHRLIVRLRNERAEIELLLASVGENR